MSEVHSQYQRGCAVLERHIFIIIEDMQHERGISSVLMRKCISAEEHKEQW